MKIMALKILREIAANIRDSDFYAMIYDDPTDAANTSQIVVCLRWVDEELMAPDEYIGLKDMSDTSAQSILKELKNVLPYRVKLCRAKVTNFLRSDENFARQSFAQKDNHNLRK